MNRSLFLFAALVGGLAAGAASAALTDPGQIMNEAYIQLVQGDQSLDAGRLDEALGLYEEARQFYGRLSEEFPGYEPKIIQYRKTYCDNQIADIQRRRAAAAAEAPATASSEPSSVVPPVAPELAPMTPAPRPAEPARSAEIDFLKSRIASLEAELADVDALEEELNALAADRDDLSAQLAEANRQLATRSLGAQEELQALRSQLAERDGRIESLQAEVDSTRGLNAALNDMEARVNELRADKARLEEEIKTLDLELDDAEIRADQAEFRAEQLENQLAAARMQAADAAEQLHADRPLPPVAEPVEPGPSESPDVAGPSAQTTAQPVTEPVPEPEPEAESASASVPPRPIPDGMLASDFIRELLQAGENEAALATVQNARRAARDDMTLALIEGIALIRLQRYNESAALLIEIAKRNPRNAEVHATLGAAMMGAGFYDEARDMLEKAVRLDKNLPECHYNLAQLYAFIEPVSLRKARRHYRNALDLGVAPDPQLDAVLK